MSLLRLIAAVIAGWLLWGWLSRHLGGAKDGASTPPDGGTEERYRKLTDQPIEDADYEDLSRK